MSNPKDHIAIVGAGLVGSLLSIYLVKRGYKVSIFERREDMRKQEVGGGRSINLALSNRGIKALDEVGLSHLIKQAAVPMHGRMVHPISGSQNFQAYGKEGQFINSISRSGLNIVLMDEAERLGVTIHFNSKIETVDLHNTKLVFGSHPNQQDSKPTEVNSINEGSFKLIIGADGAYSSVRSAFQISDLFDYSQSYIEHGYKELTIPAEKAKEHKLEKNALHIWPRESFMLIALPNLDDSFTCTLFFPFQGPLSFASIKGKADVHSFFQNYFPDALPLMPTLEEDFLSNPTSSLVTIQCWPWAKNNSLLIGDAAHGIVPFFGQGMNAGFEDCRVLNDLLNLHRDDWGRVVPEFQALRKPDTDAIAQLALGNLVDGPSFILRKKIEARLNQLFPDHWIPLYSMVTFNENIRYSTALDIGRQQKQIMDEVLAQPGIELNWEQLDFKAILGGLGAVHQF
jgi:kynurenine 3-monooxygenase